MRIVPEEAEVVNMIYDWYAAGDGYNTIAYRLNDMHIPSKAGTHWVQHSVNSILNNEAYLGKIRWKREPTQKVMENGQMVKKRKLSNDYLLYDGRHEPIITQEQWDAVKQVQMQKQHPSVRKDRKLANPFLDGIGLRKMRICDEKKYSICQTNEIKKCPTMV